MNTECCMAKKVSILLRASDGGVNEIKIVMPDDSYKHFIESVQESKFKDYLKIKEA